MPSDLPIKHPTEGQTNALHTWLQMQRENGGEPPTERELAKRLDVSRNNAKQFLLALGERGMLTRPKEGHHRQWSVTPKGLAWAKMTRQMVNGDPPKKKRSKKKIR